MITVNWSDGPWWDNRDPGVRVNGDASASCGGFKGGQTMLGQSTDVVCHMNRLGPRLVCDPQRLLNPVAFADNEASAPLPQRRVQVTQRLGQKSSPIGPREPNPSDCGINDECRNDVAGGRPGTESRVVLDPERPCEQNQRGQDLLPRPRIVTLAA